MTNEDIEFIKSGSRKRYLTEIKLEFIRFAIASKYSYKEIGSFIGISQSGISTLLLDNGYSRCFD